MDGANGKDNKRHGHIPPLLKAAWFMVPGTLILIGALPISTDFGVVLLEVPIALFLWVVMIGWSAHRLVQWGHGRQRLTNINPLAGASLAAILAIFLYFPFLHTCNYFGGALRFAATRSDYDRQVARLPANSKPRLVVFTWGGMIWASRGLVYDESDELSLPLGRQSAGWLARAGGSEFGCGNWQALPLWSHYYLVSFPC